MNILPILEFLERYWPGIMAAIVTPTLAGMGVLLKWRLDKVSRKAGDAKVEAEAAQISVNTMIAANNSVVAQLASYKEQLNAAITQLEYYKDLWVRSDGHLGDLRSQIRMMEQRSNRFEQEQLERSTANEARIKELWEYIYAWEAAIEPEPEEIQARIKARVSKARPTNGYGNGAVYE